jgi:hypothetical protein
MFVTFESGAASDEQASKRAKSTLRACNPCRARKVRCDGKVPCAACQWRHKADLCTYGAHMAGKPTNTPHKFSKIPAHSPAGRSWQQDVLNTLFPGLSYEALLTKSREELADLLRSADEPLIGEERGDTQDESNLEVLQPLPEATGERSEASSDVQEEGVTDDVNALSLSLKHSTSYLGISSVTAVLRVIHWLMPLSKVFQSAGRSSISVEGQPPTPSAISMWDEVPAINAYFQYVQPFLPLLDETVFRDTYERRDRKDDRWHLLLNCVLAMGSVVLHDAQDRKHAFFFERAKQFLTLENCASAHVETLQALAILGGTYLHYVQKPNEAGFVMGGISRMATALGLHRDYTEALRKSAPGPNPHPAIELRRRLYWCLLVIDTWNSNFLGRTATIGPGQTTQIPSTATNGSHATTALLQANIAFSRLATRFEAQLSQRPILSAKMRADLDAAFASWLDTHVLSPSLVNEKPGVLCAAATSRWRGLSARILVHRPVLLWYAMRRTGWGSLSVERRHAVNACRDNARALITDIRSTWSRPAPCQMAGWCATWMLYQAVMVPLLSLFLDCGGAEARASSVADVEAALATLRDLERWSPTAKRSLEVVMRLFEQSHDFRPAAATTTTNQQRADAGAGGVVGHDTPSTTATADSNIQDGFFLHDFIGDLAWDGDPAVAADLGMGLAPSFLDYWDGGQEANFNL